MRITIFCRREDEESDYEKFGKQYGVELNLIDGAPTPENAYLAKGSRCISIITTPISAQTLDALWNAGVRYISTRTIGYDHIDVAYAKQIGMHVGNISYSPYSVADYTLMLILMAVRRAKSIFRHADVQNYSLAGMQGRELPNLTVGIVGTGRIGRTVIARLTGFGCRMLACSRHENADVKPFAQYVPLETLLRQSDVVTLHLPANADTYHLINAQMLSYMKPDALLVNTGRGSLVDTAALIDALEQGKIGGAALDVIEHEVGLYYHDLQDKPLPNRDLALLRAFPNVIVTPHTAFYTDQAVSDMVENSIRSCIYFETGAANPWQVV